MGFLLLVLVILQLIEGVENTLKFFEFKKIKNTVLLDIFDGFINMISIRY